MFKSIRARASLMLLAVAVFALSLVGTASAEGLEVKAKDFTEPVEKQLETALPIVVGFVAVIFVVGFVIRWIQKRARGAAT